MKIDLSLANVEDTCWQRALAMLQMCLMMDLEEDKDRLMCSTEMSPLEVRQVHVMNRYVCCLEGCMGRKSMQTTSEGVGKHREGMSLI